MASTPNPPEEKFAEAGNNWKLEKLYTDLALAKGKGLTRVEKQYLRGLLCGYSPNEIANKLYVSSETVRHRLCTGVYRYIEQMLIEKAKNSIKIDWSRVPHLLEKAGYKTQSSNTSLEPKLEIPYIDWGLAPHVSVFFGRTEELTTLEQWIVTERCRLVALLGMGGIGKTALSAKLAKQIQDEFEYVIWRSLCYAPPIQEILPDLIKFLSNNQETNLPATISSGISRLIEYLRSHRCLLILDDWETILRSEHLAGYYRDGYEGYGELIKRVGESEHQSCLVLLSREKPIEITSFAVKILPVRELKLTGLQQEDAKAFLEAQGFPRSAKGLSELIGWYAGNPSALNIVATTIQQVFNGNIIHFLQQSTLVIGDILGNYLSQQFERLSVLEQEIMYWMAIERKLVSLSELKGYIWFSVSGSKLLDALESLWRRSLIEKSTEGEEALFALQPVVMKYITNQLIEQACQDMVAVVETQEIERLGILRSHALVKEQAQGDAETRVRILIITRVKDKLPTVLKGSRRIEEQLNEILLMLEEKSPTAVGYAKGNIRGLLAALKADGSGHD